MPAVIDRLIALGGPVALIIMSVVEFVILRRQGVSLAGPPTVHDLIGLNIAKKGHMAGELSEQAVRDNWNSVCSLYKYLAAGGNLLPLPTEGIRLRPGEQLYSRNVLGYARYYGTTVPYERSNHFWFGSTTFVVAGLAADSISNAVARSRAEAMAATQWRDHGHVQTILTSQRFLCDYRGQWLSFWHEGVVELVVDVPRWAFIVRYEEGAPLLLHGPAAPWFALAAARVIYGPQAYAWPAFASIAQAATNRTDAISEGLTNPDNTTQSPLA